MTTDKPSVRTLARGKSTLDAGALSLKASIWKELSNFAALGQKQAIPITTDEIF